MVEIKINKSNENQRLDKYLLKYFNKAPKSFIYKMLRKKNIKLNGKKAEGNEIIINNDIINDTIKVTYKVDINKVLALWLSFRAFLLATRQLRAVGIPVVVSARQIIKKLKIIWYIPKPVSPRILDKNIL